MDKDLLLSTAVGKLGDFLSTKSFVEILSRNSIDQNYIVLFTTDDYGEINNAILSINEVIEYKGIGLSKKHYELPSGIKIMYSGIGANIKPEFYFAELFIADKFKEKLKYLYDNHYDI